VMHQLHMQCLDVWDEFMDEYITECMNACMRMNE